MKIVKGKEPTNGRGSIDGLSLHYNLYEGHRFEYDAAGWKR
ncbi:hypothetical protein PITCH_A1400001 [uncultured Desulfobacterium sp.]|uniref:Uncharacterized protein n=1 Tax=uncultured Desulfobacterium sp. TaxID=201089 RepID=A0A445MT17_9BACT|nr:hypothetical protein PITCH_A1400001 [uncultured Desulfobacterium sp.]